MNRIKELRQKKNKTQDDIANLLHINRTTLTKWETGKHNPDVDTVIFLSDYFGVTTDYLLGVQKQTVSATEKPPTIEDVANWEGLEEDSREDLRKYLELLKLRDMAKHNKATVSEFKQKG